MAVTTGAYNVVMMAACEDEEHVAQLVTEGLRGIPGVDTLDVVTMLRETKDAYRYVPTGKADRSADRRGDRCADEAATGRR